MDQMAEKAIVKAMFSGHMSEVSEKVPFFLFKSKEAQETVKTMYGMKSVTFNTMLQARRFDTDYIYECYSMTCEEADIPYYINRLKLSHTKEMAYQHMKELNQMMLSPECTLEELTKKLRDGLDVGFSEKKSTLISLPEEYAAEHITQIKKQSDNPETRKGIRLRSLAQLDATFYGLKGGDLILACAQSGHGKTALALNIVDDLSIDQNHTGYYGNAEMTLEELTGRIASKRANIPTTEVLSGQFQEVNKYTALDKLSAEYETMGKSNLILSRIPIMSVNSLRTACTKLMNMDRAPEYLLVDYIGRMEPSRDTKGLQEWQIMYLIAEELKTLAVELDIPIIALAQLTEDGKIEGARKIKNACDGVLFFEPVTEDDEKYMSPLQKQFANYRIEKYKVRRNDNSKPIYINFTKKYQRIAEVF